MGDFYIYCYVRERLDCHMAEAERGIRFVTSGYRDLFRLADGDQIRIIKPDGKCQLAPVGQGAAVGRVGPQGVDQVVQLGLEVLGLEVLLVVEPGGVEAIALVAHVAVCPPGQQDRPG